MTLIQNRLSGPISPEMGKLANLEQMALDGNRLSGSLPAELGNLVRLESLGLNSNRITGPIPPELGNLTNLQYLNLSNNDLTGHMPSELRGLASLTYASLGYNSFAGPIPPELGKLYKLEFLDLRHNELTGSIPPELSSLSRLTNLWLHDNQLTGSIPSELAKLGNLQLLLLQGNALTGPIPSTMSSLASLEYLELARNNLTGPIPKELGQLADLISLVVADNNMTGSVPDEIGQLGRLRGLNLSGNARMSGALPASLVSLRSLTRFLAAGTDLCAPAGPAFQTWLDGLRRQRVKTCGAAEVRAYLTQAVQSREFPVPLVADQDALLRVFVTAVRPVGEVIPDVRARFFIGDAETHVVSIAARQTPIPDAVDQGSLSKSANELIPGSIVQPGLEMVIEVDPHGKLAPGSGVQKRIPETGRMSIDVKPMPTLSLTIVPFLWSAKPDSLVLETVRAMSESPGSHELLGPTLALLPIGDIAVTTHETVLTSSNSGYRILHATEALRVLEGGHGHYMGTMTGPLEHGYGGAYPWGRSSFSTIDRPNSAHTIAHELGHNMSLQHPPGCGAALADYGFPHPNGVIGSWGYDFAEGRLVPPETGDLMSYCHRDAWISEYHRTNAVRWRLRDEGAAADLVPAPVRSLLLWGGVDDFGKAFLEPSFAVDAPATMPAEGGEYSLTGSSTDGRILFSFSFGMQVADGNGNHSFVFALPVEPKWAGQLSAITLAGPDGSVTLDGASDQGMVILRNPVTGEVRGMLRVPPVEAGVHHEVAALQGELRLEILYSRGIPDVTAWER